MDIFLERHKLPKITQEEINNLNSPTATNKIELVIKSHPVKTPPGTDDFTEEFYQTFKEY